MIFSYIFQLEKMWNLIIFLVFPMKAHSSLQEYEEI